MQEGEEEEVCAFVLPVFNEFVAPQYSEEGIEEFLKYLEPHYLSERCQEDDFVLLATSQGRIVGMIELVKNSHISLIYTDGHLHGIGIGRELLKRSLEVCITNQPALTEITLNSSPNAVEIYEKLGFTVTKPEQIKNGIRFVPMKLELSRRSD
jgi:predicted GNAT family N-acyltransferase